MKNTIPRGTLISFIFFLSLVVGGLVLFTEQASSRRHCVVTSKVIISGHEYVVSISDTPRLRERGLSGTPVLVANTGMLFVFNVPSKQSFWMKDMNFPIDIIWIDKSWKVVGVVKSAQPSSYPNSFVSPDDVKYVLELNSGDAEANGISVGTSVLSDELCLNS